MIEAGRHMPLPLPRPRGLEIAVNYQSKRNVAAVNYDDHRRVPINSVRPAVSVRLQQERASHPTSQVASIRHDTNIVELREVAGNSHAVDRKVVPKKAEAPRGERAMPEYRVPQTTELKKTERLRAARLAREVDKQHQK
jgi:hypothetical protein